MKTKLTTALVLLALLGLTLGGVAAPTPAASPSAAASDVPAAPDAPTFTKDIAPILFQNCTTCHRPGEVAPFALTNYKEAKKHARQIADVTSDKIMPPWKPEAGHGDFLGERRLPEPQIRLIDQWAKAGAPEGDPAALPPLPKFTEGWMLGEPDLVVKIPEAYTLRAEGRDVFRCFVVPLNLDEDKYVTAVDFKPGNPKIVHHALLYLDATGTARSLDAKDAEPGYPGAGGPGFLPTGSLGGWSPGYTPRHLPEGVGRLVRKGSDLVIQEHLHPSGKQEVEQSSIGLYFSKKPTDKLTNAFPKVSRPLDIPPGEKNYVIDDTFDVPVDVTLVGIIPHAHLLCKEIKVDANFADGSTRPLIWIKDWDWGWQDQYWYRESVRIPRGTKISLHYVYDNSADNARNPSTPPKRVRWGEQTTDEMAITFFQIVTDRGAGGGLLGGLLGGGRRAAGAPATRPAENGANGSKDAKDGAKEGAAEKKADAAADDFDLSALPPRVQQMILRRFDKNGNGKLDPDENQEAREALRQLLDRSGGL